jgi:hypothetical protein
MFCKITTCVWDLKCKLPFLRGRVIEAQRMFRFISLRFTKKNHDELRCAESKKYMKFFLPFLLFIFKVHSMKWKKLTLVFDENASFSFNGPSKFFWFGDFKHFFQNFWIFKEKKLYIFLKLIIKLCIIR